MKKEVYNSIITSLKVRIELCDLYLHNIETTKDLLKLSIEEAQKLQKFCREEEALMTKLCTSDLYHLIGMGNLTPPQMMTFSFLIRDYLQYRSLIKTIAMNFDSISKLPGIPVTSVYRLHSFQNIVLSSGVDASSVPTDLVPFTIQGETIKVCADKVNDFIAVWSNLSKVNFSATNLLQKANSGSEYGGIKWHVDVDGNLIGTFNAKNAYNGLEIYYNSCLQTAQK